MQFSGRELAQMLGSHPALWKSWGTPGPKQVVKGPNRSSVKGPQGLTESSVQSCSPRAEEPPALPPLSGYSTSGYENDEKIAGVQSVW